MNIIPIVLIIISSLYLIWFFTKKDSKKEKAEQYIKKAQTTAKRIQNINKHLKIADASKNLHEVRIHAREAMRLIKKYGLVNEYRKLLKK